MGHPLVALIAARPGRLRDGWRALLLGTGQIGSVLVADDRSTAVRLAELLVPELVLLDVEAFEEEASSLLEQLKMDRPGSRLIALVRDAGKPGEPGLAGADVALVKGLPAATFLETVRRLLGEGGSPG